MILYLVQGLTLGFSAAVSPGPLQAFLLAQATAHGGRRTLLLALVPLVSDGPILFLVLFVLVRAPDLFLRVLGIAGGLFLLYLAYGAFRTARHFSAVSTSPPAARTFLQAVLTNLLSPNPWLFWTVVGGPLVIEAWQLDPPGALLFLLSFYLLLILGNALFIILFARTRHFGPALPRVLNAAAAVVLLVYGGYQLWHGLAG